MFDHVGDGPTADTAEPHFSQCPPSRDLAFGDASSSPPARDPTLFLPLHFNPPASCNIFHLGPQDAVTAEQCVDAASGANYQGIDSCVPSLNLHHTDATVVELDSEVFFANPHLPTTFAPDQLVSQQWQQCINLSNAESDAGLELLRQFIDISAAKPNLATPPPSPRVDPDIMGQCFKTLSFETIFLSEDFKGQSQCGVYIDPSRIEIQAQPCESPLDDIEGILFSKAQGTGSESAWTALSKIRQDASSHNDDPFVYMDGARDEAGVIVSPRPARKSRARVRNPILEEWLLANAAYPYPDADQLSTLAQMSGRSLRQTRNALSNLRARKRPDLSTNSTYAGLTAYPGDSYAPRMAHTSETTSPTISTVNHATPYGIGAYPSPLSTLNDADHGFRNDCFDTFEHSASDESMDCNVSTRCDGVLAPAALTNGGITLRRKGKRRHGSRYEACDLNRDSSTRHNKAELKFLTTGAPQFHCTVCPKPFKNAWSWRRHEYGTHDFHPVEWTCMLHETIVIGMTCIFCAQPVDDYDHFDQHNIVPCGHRDAASRTFALEDRLKQHVQQIHLLKVDDKLKKGFKPPAMWSRAVQADKIHPDSLWCGFCCISLQSTILRMDHVAQHFRDGLSMVGWSRRPVENSKQRTFNLVP